MPRKLQYNYLRHALFNLQSAPTVVDVGSACLVPVDQLQRQPDPTADEDMQLSDDYTGGRNPPPPAQCGRERILVQTLRNTDCR